MAAAYTNQKHTGHTLHVGPNYMYKPLMARATNELIHFHSGVTCDLLLTIIMKVHSFYRAQASETKQQVDFLHIHVIMFVHLKPGSHYGDKWLHANLCIMKIFENMEAMNFNVLQYLMKSQVLVDSLCHSQPYSFGMAKLSKCLKIFCDTKVSFC